MVRGSTPGAEEWRRLTEDPREEHIDRRVLEYLRPEADDVTELAFSSGTTGEPKGILHTHNSALCAVRDVRWLAPAGDVAAGGR